MFDSLFSDFSFPTHHVPFLHSVLSLSLSSTFTPPNNNSSSHDVDLLAKMVQEMDGGDGEGEGESDLPAPPSPSSLLAVRDPGSGRPTQGIDYSPREGKDRVGFDRRQISLQMRTAASAVASGSAAAAASSRPASDCFRWPSSRLTTGRSKASRQRERMEVRILGINQVLYIIRMGLTFSNQYSQSSCLIRACMNKYCHSHNR